MKPALAKTTPELWVLRQAYPVISSTATAIHLNHESDGDSFDDIWSAHVLKLGRNTEQGIVIVANNMDIHDDVLQSLHQWPQHVGEVGLDIPWFPDWNGASN